MGIYLLPGIIAVLFPLFSCSENTPNLSEEVIKEEKNEDSSNYNSLLIGEWHFYSGKIASIIGAKGINIYNQILTFNSAGNYIETNTLMKGDEEHKGNWSTTSDYIFINDWNGNMSNHSIRITNISEKQLSLSIDGNTAIYIKKENIFDNLQQNILGYWYEFTDKEHIPFYVFNNDKTASHVFWRYIFNTVSPTIAKYEWELEILQNHKLILYYENMPHGAFYIAEEYTIKYCNQNYIGLENAGQVKNLYRQNK